MNTDTHDELAEFMSAIVRAEAEYKRVLVKLDALNFRVSVLAKREAHDEPFPFFEGARAVADAHATAEKARLTVQHHLIRYWRAHLRILGTKADPLVRSVVHTVVNKYNNGPGPFGPEATIEQLLEFVAYLNLGHLTELELLTEVHRALLEGAP